MVWEGPVPKGVDLSMSHPPDAPPSNRRRRFGFYHYKTGNVRRKWVPPPFYPNPTIHNIRL